ncbi:rRNA-processing protein utp23 [Psilocybe cubensis]|uniref:U three protein 23 n=2 Tax=Psilocybe cubensis TaxID=181762 RepID=A0A8H8CRI6_PSICU|nr:rRNA-processing protein utp23 [Psilocybe cubensis]KAH9486759.1 rRNA-processing protein utp23 [Psilocybe cubensis]
MRQKRAKAYRKLMHLYCMTFGFRQPYQILIDSEMCKSAVAQKIDFVKQLHTVLQGEVKPMITQCCIHELYLQGKQQQPAVDLAKTFERRKCNHREPIGGDDCLASVVGDSNKHRYVVATQSQTLRVKLRFIPGTPIIHINRSVMVLEPPSDTTVQAKERAEDTKLHASAPDLALVPVTAPEERRVKRKGPKGPNPLSVKKKQSNEPTKPPTKAQPPTGSKRKVDDVDSDPEGESIPAQVSAPTAASKRRKRRRKNKGAVDMDTQRAESDSVKS